MTATTDPAELADVVGLHITTGARTLSAGECAILTSVCWTRGPMHTDVTAAEQSLFGSLSLAGPLIAAIASGLWSTSPLMATLHDRYGIRLSAVLGSEVRYRKPLIVGDTVRLDITVSEARRSRSVPGRVVLTLDERVLNAHGDCLAEIAEHLLADITTG